MTRPTSRHSPVFDRPVSAPVVEARRILRNGTDVGELEITCPYCGELHYHGGCGGPGQGDGHRGSHCTHPASAPGYILSEVGAQEGRSRIKRRAGQLGVRIVPCERLVSVRTRTRIMERDGFRCRRCGVGPCDERLVVDHVVPVALGGSSDDTNLQVLCEPCNQGKADRRPHPHDFEEFR